MTGEVEALAGEALRQARAQEERACPDGTGRQIVPPAGPGRTR
ncbi:hypothetical protein [Streptomyces sp. WG7]